MKSRHGQHDCEGGSTDGPNGRGDKAAEKFNWIVGTKARILFDWIVTQQGE